MATTNINIRVDEDVKRRSELLFQELGMNLTTAVNIFLRQSLRSNGLPFEARLNKPNAETLAAMAETDDIIAGRKQVKSYSSARDMISDLNGEDDDDADA